MSLAMATDHRERAEHARRSCGAYLDFTSWMITRLREKKVPLNMNSILPEGNVMSRGLMAIEREDVFTDMIQQMIVDGILRQLEGNLVELDPAGVFTYWCLSNFNRDWIHNARTQESLNISTKEILVNIQSYLWKRSEEGRVVQQSSSQITTRPTGPPNMYQVPTQQYAPLSTEREFRKRSREMEASSTMPGNNEVPGMAYLDMHSQERDIDSNGASMPKKPRLDYFQLGSVQGLNSIQSAYYHSSISGVSSFSAGFDVPQSQHKISVGTAQLNGKRKPNRTNAQATTSQQIIDANHPILAFRSFRSKFPSAAVTLRHDNSTGGMYVECGDCPEFVIKLDSQGLSFAKMERHLNGPSHQSIALAKKGQISRISSTLFQMKFNDQETQGSQGVSSECSLKNGVSPSHDLSNWERVSTRSISTNLEAPATINQCERSGTASAQLSQDYHVVQANVSNLTSATAGIHQNRCAEVGTKNEHENRIMKLEQSNLQLAEKLQAMEANQAQIQGYRDELARLNIQQKNTWARTEKLNSSVVDRDKYNGYRFDKANDKSDEISTTLGKRLESLEENSSVVKEEFAAFKKDVVSVRESLSVTNAKATQLEAITAQLEAKTTQLEIKIDMGDLQNSLVATNLKVTELTESLKKTNQAAETFKSSYSIKFKTQKTESEKVISELRCIATVSATELAALKLAVEEFQNAKASLKKSVAESVEKEAINARVVALETELHQVKESLRLTREASRAQVQDFENEIKALTREAGEKAAAMKKLHVGEVKEITKANNAVLEHLNARLERLEGRDNDVADAIVVDHPGAGVSVSVSVPADAIPAVSVATKKVVAKRSSGGRGRGSQRRGGGGVGDV